MSLIQEIRERNDTALGAAKELGRGLMRGNSDELKQGYDYKGATMAAGDSFSLPKMDRLELEVYLLGFAHGLNQTDISEMTLREASLEQQLETISEHLSTALREGYNAGRAEWHEKTQPAPLPATRTDIPDE